jgi:hypothetical protein
MRQLRDTTWQRRGTSWIWDAVARDKVGSASEVWSLRQFLQAKGSWPEGLPSNDNQTLVVGGLEGALDVLSPTDAENWLGKAIKGAILSFQEFYDGEASLIFWIPSGRERLDINLATDDVSWCCAHPHQDQRIDFGRILWGQANEYPQRILLPETSSPIGLFHLRIT